jgi:ABC-type uncharacterized transport system permease subunit
MLAGAILVGVRPWWLAVIGVAVTNLIGAAAGWLVDETESFADAKKE